MPNLIAGKTIGMMSLTEPGGGSDAAPRRRSRDGLAGDEPGDPPWGHDAHGSGGSGSDAWDFIADPFYDNGGVDKGAFWQISKSLGRVAIGFSIAAVVGIALGVLIGQSTWAMRGLDPIFQVLRTIPPLAWLPLSLAGFRDAQPSAIFVIFITSICFNLMSDGLRAAMDVKA